MMEFMYQAPIVIQIFLANDFIFFLFVVALFMLFSLHDRPDGVNLKMERICASVFRKK